VLQIRDKLKQLKLNDSEVWEREEQRKKELGDVLAPWYIKAPFWVLCVVLDVFFANRWVYCTVQYCTVLYGTVLQYRRCSVLCCVVLGAVTRSLGTAWQNG
jgi:hypothetical protein